MKELILKDFRTGRIRGNYVWSDTLEDSEIASDIRRLAYVAGARNLDGELVVNGECVRSEPLTHFRKFGMEKKK